MTSGQWRDWWESECRNGGSVQQYFAWKKHKVEKQIRALARREFGRKQNNKSEFNHNFTVPASLYHAWKSVDEYFWDDPANLRSMKRDNPIMSHLINV